MANRRMISLDVVDTDAFLEMPATSQNLYFHLSARGDDDGFVASPNKVMKICNASRNDYDILIAKQFIIPFDSGVCVIRHRKIHNYLRSDRYKETMYKDEKSKLALDGDVYQLSTIGIPMVDVGKDSIGKDKVDEDSIVEENKGEILSNDNTPYKKKNIINKNNKQPATKIYDYIKKLTGVIDGDLSDCVYLHYKLESITHYEGSSIEKLEQIIPLMIKSNLSKFYSISSPSKLCENLGTIVAKLTTEKFKEVEAADNHIYIKQG